MDGPYLPNLADFQSQANIFGAAIGATGKPKSDNLPKLVLVSSIGGSCICATKKPD